MDNSDGSSPQWRGVRPAVRQAAAALADCLERGLPQDGAVFDFMESALELPDGSSGHVALAAVLDQEDSSDALTLRGLLLTPDPGLMAALEPALERARCSAAEAEILADHLARTCRKTWAILPGGASVPLALDPGDVRAFVRGLAPDRSAPPELTVLLDERFLPEEALALKVLLRHCRLAWSPTRLAFMAALLGRLDAAGPPGPDVRLVGNPDDRTDAHAVLAWALDFLDTAGLQVSARPALARRYQELCALAGRAEQFEQALARSSYEIMASQGMRSPHLHAGSLRRDLALLDRACRAVLGLPAALLDAPAMEADLGGYEDAESLMAALTRLEG